MGEASLASVSALDSVPLTGSRLSLQTEPIPGGSDNLYDYCYSDPINCDDRTTVACSYDQADRDTGTGYGCDDFGRTTTVPSVDASLIGVGICIAASASVCIAAVAAGVALDGVNRLGGCAIEHCSEKQWSGAGAHWVFDSALAFVAKPVQGEVTDPFSGEAISFSSAMGGPLRSTAIANGFMRTLGQVAFWGASTEWH